MLREKLVLAGGGRQSRCDGPVVDRRKGEFDKNAMGAFTFALGYHRDSVCNQRVQVVEEGEGIWDGDVQQSSPVRVAASTARRVRCLFAYKKGS